MALSEYGSSSALPPEDDVQENREEVENRAGKHPQVPDRMEVGHLLIHIKCCAYRVAEPAGNQQVDASGIEYRSEIPDAEYNQPTHDEINHSRYPLGAVDPECLNTYPERGERPDEDEQLHAACFAECHEAEGRVRPCDEQVDRGVIENLKYVLRLGMRDAVVESRRRILKDHREAVDNGCYDLVRVGLHPGVHQRQCDADDSKDDSQPVNDGIRNLLTHRILFGSGEVARVDVGRLRSGGDAALGQGVPALDRCVARW